MLGGSETTTAGQKTGWKQPRNCCPAAVVREEREERGSELWIELCFVD